MQLGVQPIQQVSSRRPKIIALVCVLLILVTLGATLAYVIREGQGGVQRTIDKEVAQVHMPTALKLQSKVWAGQVANGKTTVVPGWSYEYSVEQPLSPTQLADAIQASLEQAGYKVTRPIQGDPSTISLSAQNDIVAIAIDVNSYGHGNATTVTMYAQDVKQAGPSGLVRSSEA